MEHPLLPRLNVRIDQDRGLGLLSFLTGAPQGRPTKRGALSALFRDEGSRWNADAPPGTVRDEVFTGPVGELMLSGSGITTGDRIPGKGVKTVDAGMMVLVHLPLFARNPEPGDLPPFRYRTVPRSREIPVRPRRFQGYPKPILWAQDDGTSENPDDSGHGLVGG